MIIAAQDDDREAKLAEAAWAVLLDKPDGPISVAKLGQAIGRRTGLSIRGVLGSKPLSQFLRERFAGKLDIKGQGPAVEVDFATGDSPESRRFDPAVFAAFSKELGGERRWLKITRPFRFNDGEASKTDNALEVPGAMIAPADMPRDARIELIEHNIRAWSKEHGLDDAAFVAQPKVKPPPSEAKRAGVEALMNLIEAVPPAERRNFTLPLDLIARLLEA
jgi:hypothetical protein